MKGNIMLQTAAILLVCVGAMHSILGGKNLIGPLMKRDDFPVVLGSQRNGRLTLWFGWHALSFFWWAQAYVFWRMASDPAQTAQATLLAWAFSCAAIGGVALIVSRGKHLSWVFFLPVAVLLALSAS